MTLAGRHLIVTGDQGVAGLSVEKVGDYSPVLSQKGYTFWTEVSPPEGEGHQPVFAPPHVYWVRDRRVERINVRSEGCQEPEQVTEELSSSPKSAPAVGHFQKRTHIVWPSSEHLSMLTVGPQNAPLGNGDGALKEVRVMADGRWYTPAFVPTTGHWVAVDTAGSFLRVSIGGSYSDDANLAFENGDLIPENSATVSPPQRVGPYIFVAYWGDEEEGIVRLHVDSGTIDHYVPDHAALSLARPQEVSTTPLPLGDEGVVWPARGDARAYFVPVGADAEAHWISVHGANELHHRHAVCVGRQIISWAPHPDDSSQTRIVTYDQEQRDLNATSHIDVPSIAPGQIRRLVYTPGFPGHAPALLGQSTDKLMYIYPRK